MNWYKRDYLKNMLLYGWNFARFLRLGLGIVVLTGSIINSDWLLGTLGLMLFAQAFFNTGCCGAGACDVNANANRKGN